MMWTISKKIPARDGLATLSAATGVAAVSKLGPSLDAVKVAACAAGYFRSRASLAGASEGRLNRYYEVVWAHLVTQCPEISEWFAAFAIHAFKAAEFFEGSKATVGVAEFVRWAEKAGQWDTEDTDAVIANIVTLLEVGHKQLLATRTEWRPS